METQLAKVGGRTHNPRLIGGGDSIEFTYDYSRASGDDRPVENIREFTTIGDAKKKQAEDDKYRITLEWYEPNDNVPERIYTARAGGGDRTVTFTYVHPISLIGRSDYDAESGGSFTCYIADFAAKRAGKNELGQESYRCRLTVQEI